MIGAFILQNRRRLAVAAGGLALFLTAAPANAIDACEPNFRKFREETYGAYVDCRYYGAGSANAPLAPDSSGPVGAGGIGGSGGGSGGSGGGSGGSGGGGGHNNHGIVFPAFINGLPGSNGGGSGGSGSGSGGSGGGGTPTSTVLTAVFTSKFDFTHMCDVYQPGCWLRGEFTHIDPPMAFGFLYESTGPDFIRLLLPNVGNGLFDVWDMTGEAPVSLITDLASGTVFTFAPGISRFAVTGIEEEAGIDSEGGDFVTGLWLDDAAESDPFSITQTSLVLAVASPAPEPGIWAMMIAGFGAVGTALRRARAKPATA